MRRFVDLHTHSTASDGDMPPAEVIRLAESRRLAAVALTDHDTVSGLSEARRAADSLTVQFVPGIEISAKFTGGLLHILGLGIDPTDRNLLETARLLREARNDRNPRMIARLQKLGMEISMDELFEFAFASPGRSGRRRVRITNGEPAVVGRLHMARLLVAKGYVRSVTEAFNRYLGRDGPAYIDKEKLAPRQAIEAIHSAGGVAILAHPVELRCNNNAMLTRVVRSMVRNGLDGIEVYHSSHNPIQTRAYLDLARREGLLISGGSDFHGSVKSSVKLGRPRVPREAVEQILARITR